MSTNPSQPPPSQPPRTTPQQIASQVHEYAIAVTKIMGSGILVLFALATGYLALRLAWWVVNFICTSLNL